MKIENKHIVVIVIIAVLVLVYFKGIELSGSVKLDKKTASGISSRVFDKSELLKGQIVTVKYTSSIGDGQGGWSLKMKLPPGWSLQESLIQSPDGYYRKYISGLSVTYHLIAPNVEGNYQFNMDEHCVPVIVSGQRQVCEYAKYPSVTINVKSCIPSPEICDNEDNDCNGIIDNGLTQSQNCGSNVGYCQYGTQTKTCSAGVWGSFGTCIGGRTAITEICNNGIDEDCNGQDKIRNTIADTNCNGCVSDLEWPSAVSKWETQTGISDSEWPIVVSKWESQEGC